MFKAAQRLPPFPSRRVCMPQAGRTLGWSPGQVSLAICAGDTAPRLLGCPCPSGILRRLSSSPMRRRVRNETLDGGGAAWCGRGPCGSRRLAGRGTGGRCGERPQDGGGWPYPNVNLSTLLSTSADWSSCASGWRMDTRTLLTVAWWIPCRAHRTEMATAVTLVTSRPSTGWGPGGQRGCSARGGQALETTDGAQEG